MRLLLFEAVRVFTETVSPSAVDVATDAITTWISGSLGLGLLASFVWLLLSGRLVPRSTADASVASVLQASETKDRAQEERVSAAKETIEFYKGQLDELSRAYDEVREQNETLREQLVEAVLPFYRATDSLIKTPTELGGINGK